MRHPNQKAPSSASHFAWGDRLTPGRGQAGLGGVARASHRTRAGARYRAEGTGVLYGKPVGTTMALRRDSVKQLVAAIRTFIEGWNERCHPFTWTKTADQILPHATRKPNSDAGH
jgi:hypothetical protein